MRKDAIELEELRLKEISTVDDYKAVHERHRIFPAIFEDRNHKRILDTSAGVGVAGKRIKDNYNADLLCNDISPKCLRTMEDSGLSTVSFDIDDDEKPFPFEDRRFDAIISLATIEHLMHLDHYIKEIHRILSNDGHLYISAPNYSGLTYLLPFLLTGRTFHDPLSESDRYEFYAHVRYFTYRTLLEFVSSLGFTLDTVYLPLPHSSTRYKKLRNQSKIKALIFRYAMKLIYTVSPRWAAEPVLCFKKTMMRTNGKIRKVIL